MKYFEKRKNVIGFNAACLILSFSFSVKYSFQLIGFSGKKDPLVDFKFILVDVQLFVLIGSLAGLWLTFIP